MEALPLIVVGLSVGFLFLMQQRSSRQRRALQEVQASLQPGQEVQTSSGLYATVVELGPDVVVLETGPGQHSRWDRRAILRVVTSTEAEAEPARVGEEEGPPSPSSSAGD